MERPRVTQKVIDIITTVLDYQDAKGFEKYGTSIDDAKDSDYDWDNMALEEMADCVKYLIKENQRVKFQLYVERDRVKRLEKLVKK